MSKAPKSYVRTVDVPRPRLGNNVADAERLISVLKKDLGTGHIRFPMDLALDFPGKLRQWNHRVKVVLFRDSRGWFLVDIQEPEMDTDNPLFGLAVDLGTTRIVMRLVCLRETISPASSGLSPRGDASGEPFTGSSGVSSPGHSSWESVTGSSSASPRGDGFGKPVTDSPSCSGIAFDNPQVAAGPDILARIHHGGTSRGRKELQELVINGINEHIAILCRDMGIMPSRILLMTVAGNSAMTHLFLGMEASFLIREPYIPAVNSPEPVRASSLGLDLPPRAVVYLFPNIGSYFGGDLVSGLLFAGIHKKENPCIMVDVGTNAEVVVGCREWLIACAGAAGPALEGGVSRMGMTAGPGVIDRVKIDPSTGYVDIHTIDDALPLGICGSGMIDLAAQLFLAGMLDIRGKFVPWVCGERYMEMDDEGEGGAAFLLVDRLHSGTGEDIVLTQIEMNSLTSSKAAMYSILQVIVENTAGMEFSQLEKFYVAGTFGSFIDPASAISIGMLPDIDMDRFEVLGNSSLEGAAQLLLNPGDFDEIEKIRQGITYIELNVNQEFMNIFSGAKFYPHTDISRFPSVKDTIKKVT
ncbi:MAG: DUF4445 domain-containing protein [Desulfamplus sp.]|nr:DUF4445 domain-containing protein [Desulfamplus sp.]